MTGIGVTAKLIGDAGSYGTKTLFSTPLPVSSFRFSCVVVTENFLELIVNSEFRARTSFTIDLCFVILIRSGIMFTLDLNTIKCIARKGPRMANFAFY